MSETDPNTGNSGDVKIDPKADAPKSGGSGSLGAGESGVVAPADWPTDWREKTAEAVIGKKDGDDYAKELKRLQRINSPTETYKSFRELEKKFSSIKQAPELPKDATPEQVAEYRKAVGVPEKADGYMDGLKDLPIGDELKPHVMKFLEDMHGKHASPAVVKDALQSYMAIAEANNQARSEADEEAKRVSRSELQKEWGGEYKTNFNAISGLMDQYPALKEALAFGRSADGTPIGYNAKAMRELAMLSREINPLHTIVTSGSGDKAQLVSDEIKHLEGLMGDHGSEYWKGPNAQKNQERYRELVGAVKK